MNRRRFPQTAQLEVLERITAFAAKVHDHKLTGWKRSRHSSMAVCTVCSRTVTVYRSLVQPDIWGDVLSSK